MFSSYSCHNEDFCVTPTVNTSVTGTVKMYTAHTSNFTHLETHNHRECYTGLGIVAKGKVVIQVLQIAKLKKIVGETMHTLSNPATYVCTYLIVNHELWSS